MEGYPVNDEEVDLLINELAERYGYDFTNYAKSSFKRRVNRLLVVERIPSFAELFYLVKSDPDYLSHLVNELTVNVTEMFRDPFVFRAIREKILPVLATHPLIRIWHAGCASGEEVYSMAILLEEANFYISRCFMPPTESVHYRKPSCRYFSNEPDETVF